MHYKQTMSSSLSIGQSENNSCKIKPSFKIIYYKILFQVRFLYCFTQDMFIEKGFTVKESKECGATGNMALLTMARYN